MNSMVKKIKDNVAIVALLIAGLGVLAYAVMHKSDKQSTTAAPTGSSAISYMIGNQIGANLKRQGIENLDKKALAEAVEDGFNGKNKMTQEEMQKAMQALQQSLMQKNEKAQDDSMTASLQFLRANAQKEGVKTTKSGLQYMVLEEGKGKAVKADSTVIVHQKTTLIDGKVVDNSYDRKTPAKIKVSAVIKGWGEGLQLMHKGSKYRLYIPPDLAYGKAPTPTIPGNSALIMEVEVVDVE